MAYPTRESNNNEGGSPNETERTAVGDYMEATKQADAKDTDGQYDQTTVGPYVDREHPHSKKENRDPGDHPHKDLNKHAHLDPDGDEGDTY